MKYSEKYFAELIKSVDVKFNGDRPWDIKVNNEKLYSRILAEGSLGLGEAYMDGWWECDQLDVMITKLLGGEIEQKIREKPLALIRLLMSRVFNFQSKSRAFNIGEAHYDAGNDLYQKMLGERMVYTCGYWKSASNLDDAQTAKLDLVCKKINLQPGQTVLDIGCGWGAFAKFAAENYGANVVGITVSKEQKKLADKLCEGLPVEIRLQDYRDTNEQFDHIISLGMFEHVGYKNYKTYMKSAYKALKPGGYFLLHTIGGNKSVHGTNPWIDKYVFPDSMLPSVAQIGKSIEGLFVMEDWHNFGPDYDKTLMAWYDYFSKAWPELDGKYSEQFKRMWDYYLLSCAGIFRSRKGQLWQIVLSKGDIKSIPNHVRSS